MTVDYVKTANTKIKSIEIVLVVLEKRKLFFILILTVQGSHGSKNQRHFNDFIFFLSFFLKKDIK